MNNGNPVGGMLQITDEWGKDVPSHWTIYFSVENIDGAIAKAQASSATMLYDPVMVPEVGRFTKIRDPQGVHFSLIQFAQ